MAKIPQEIENAVREYAEQLSREIPVKKVILFGSYANNTNTSESDVDIAVFSDHFEKISRIESIRFLLSRARKYAYLDFQPLPFTYKEYIEKDDFVSEVLKNGIEINIENTGSH